jgi:uroporphyrinogen-III synthase
LRVVVTRPEPGASATAARLAARGMEPVLLPLTQIRPLHPSLPAGPFDAAILTSANAIRSAGRELVEQVSTMPVFAVGDATAAAARKAGCVNVRVGEGDAVLLARLVADLLPAPASVLYLAGRLRTPGLEAALGRLGHRVKVVETYDAPPILRSQDELRRLLAPAPDFCLVHSGRAAELLVEIAGSDPAGTLLSTTRVAAISRPVAAALEPAFSSRVLVAESPDEASLLALLPNIA